MNATTVTQAVDGMSGMELLWLGLVEYKELRKLNKEDREKALKGVLQRFELLVSRGSSEQRLSKNESSKELDETTIPFLLGYYYVGKILNDYVHENRFKALTIASNNFIIFLEILNDYGMLPPDEAAEVVAMQQEAGLGGEKDEKDEMIEHVKPQQGIAKALATRQRAQQEFRVQQEAEAMHGKIADLMQSTKREDYDTARDLLEKYLRTLIVSAKFGALKELKYLYEEMQMLLFEKNNPEEAERIRKDHMRYGDPDNAKKSINMVSLTEQDIASIDKSKPIQISNAEDLKRLEVIKQEARKQGAFVPKDCIELLREGNEGAAVAMAPTKAGLGGIATASNITTRDVLGQADGLRLNSEQFTGLNLVYGGGNPYTGQLPGDPNGDHRNVVYKVSRTETMQPGTKDDEPDEDKPPSDYSDDEEMHRKRKDDDENDGRKRGWGNRYRRM